SHAAGGLPSPPFSSLDQFGGATGTHATQRSYWAGTEGEAATRPPAKVHSVTAVWCDPPLAAAGFTSASGTSARTHRPASGCETRYRFGHLQDVAENRRRR